MTLPEAIFFSILAICVACVIVALFVSVGDHKFPWER